MAEIPLRRAAVIGLGRMGFRHLKALAHIGAPIVAASDVRAETKNALLETYPDAHWYQNWRELLEKEAFEILCIVTNGPSHAEIVIEAAKKGVTIFCEKPMATNVADAQKMVAAADEKLFINLTLRAIPEFQRMRAFLHDGTLGNTRVIIVSIGGARGLGCVGSHYVDLMRVITRSDATNVWGRINKNPAPNPRGTAFRDPGGYAVYEFENGARGILEMSEDYPLPPQMTVLCTKGRIDVDLSQNAWRAYRFEGATYTELPFGPVAPMDIVAGTAAMISDALGEKKIAATGEDGIRALEMILGIHLSDTAGRAIAFPFSKKDYSFDVPMT